MPGSRGRRRLAVHGESFGERPSYDAAVSRSLLLRVAAGDAPESLRLHRAGCSLAFSSLDRASPRFDAAVAAAVDAGFEPVLRLAGGRAALFHGETLAFAWCVPSREPRRGVAARFDETASVLTAALGRLGVDARVGQVPGEYCPGAHSVNARGRRKLAGIGQRLVRGAAHVGGVVVVRGSERVGTALDAVYRALELPFEPATSGAVEDEVPGVTCEDVVEALRAELASRFELFDAELEPAVLERARELEPLHRVQARAGTRAGTGGGVAWPPSRPGLR